ncbi:hypothetical protein K469DRAFT_717331 [Zopfia rhizophila CBS 207.26]|uniref:BZIP domain-containing protein n=1 Tax=Zopfia rhizophila CBS 207.26 TaxID=1314779 RepID=A0A6A6EPW4_9PEZI|nr:hypothetical protein K469DRAFT_717331 [Zopfia rhizophila CBS 207.26]
MDTAFHPLAWTIDSIAAIEAWPSPISLGSPNNTTAPPSTPTSATLPSFPIGISPLKFGQITPPHEPSSAHSRRESTRSNFSFTVEQPHTKTLLPPEKQSSAPGEKPPLQAPVLEIPSTSIERRQTPKEHISHTPPYPPPSSQATKPAKRSRGRPKLQPAIANSNSPSEREIHKQKNRIAAQKCRQRQKHYIQDLETRGREVTTTNKRLKEQVVVLTDELLMLKNEVLNHAGCDMEGMEGYLNRCMAELLAWKSDNSSSVAGASKSGSYVSAESMTFRELIKEEIMRAGGKTGSEEMKYEVEDLGGLEMLRDIDSGDEDVESVAT